MFNHVKNNIMHGMSFLGLRQLAAGDREFMQRRASKYRGVVEFAWSRLP